MNWLTRTILGTLVLVLPLAALTGFCANDPNNIDPFGLADSGSIDQKLDDLEASDYRYGSQMHGDPRTEFKKMSSDAAVTVLSAGSPLIPDSAIERLLSRISRVLPICRKVCSCNSAKSSSMGDELITLYHHTSGKGGLGINQTGVLEGSGTPGLWKPWQTGDV